MIVKGCKIERGADLYGAILYGAILYGADILTFQFKRYFAFCYGNRIQIGCENKTITEWVDTVGKAKSEGFDEIETAAYRGFIRLCEQIRGATK